VTSFSLETADLVSRALDSIREGKLEAALEQVEALTAVAPDLRAAWACKVLLARRLGLDEVEREARERLMVLSPVAGNA